MTWNWRKWWWAPEPTGSIKGRAFHDADGDNTEWNGAGHRWEDPVEGVRVTLRNADGETVATTETGGNGWYRFDDVAAGEYSVAFTPPEGLDFVARDVGGKGADSDAGTDGTTETFHLGAGKHLTNIDAGLKPDPTPEPEPDTGHDDCIVIEAEDMRERGFREKDGDQASGGELVKLARGDGKLWTAFEGESGRYDLSVVAQDETDGASRIKLFINGEKVESFRLDRQTDGAGSDDGGFTDFDLGAFDIAEGDRIELRAWKDGNEYVRIDKLVLKPADPAPDPTPEPDPDPVPDTGHDGCSFVIDGPVQTRLSFANLADGTVEVTVEVLDATGQIGDLRGLFFEIADESLLPGLTVTGADITDRAIAADAVTDLGGGVNVNGGVANGFGGFDIGLEFGTQGIGGDDIRSTSFVVGHATEALGASIFSEQDFAVRLTSVGEEDGGRGNSLKLATTAPVIDKPATDPHDGQICIDFETLGDGTPLLAGDLIDGLALDGVTFRADRGNDGDATFEEAMIFDAANPTGGDGDLFQPAQGNVLIISEDRDGTDPDDNARGGTIIAEFDAPSTVHEITVLDTEERGGSVDLFDAGGALLGRVAIPAIANGTIRTVDLGDIADVAKMTVSLKGSGAIDTFKFTPGDTPPPLGSIGDFVFLDADGDGVQGAGETGVAGVTVTLTGGGADAQIGTADDTTATQVTGADGAYLFDGLAANDYKVSFSTLPADTAFTKADQGDDALDSDAVAMAGDPGTAMTGVVSLAAGEDNLTLDAGIVALAALGDRVFHDRNANGVQDAGEEGIAGATVTLLNADGTPATDADGVAQSVATDADGLYLFDRLRPGDYRVQFSQPGGFTQAAPLDAGTDDAADSDADPADALTTAVISLDPGETDPTVDAGFFNPAGLGDFVFRDSDKDGVQDPGEPGVAGVTVNLLDDAMTPIATTATDASGAYDFTGLTPGTYFVEFVAPETPAGSTQGQVFTFRDQGTDDGLDSDADRATGKTDAIELESGEFDDSIDAGLKAAFVIPEDGLIGVGNAFESPIAQFNNDGRTAFDAETGAFEVNATALFFTRDDGSSFLFEPFGQGRVLLDIQLDANGDLVDGAAGFTVFDDLNMNRQFDADESVYISGDVFAFGSEDNGSTDLYDAFIEVTGGSLQAEFEPIIGINVSSEFSGFTGDFTADFAGEGKGSFGDLTIECIAGFDDHAM